MTTKQKQTLIQNLHKHQKAILGVCGGFFILCVFVCLQALMTLQTGITPMPEKYLGSQKVYQAVNNAELALKKARISETKQDLMANLSTFRSSIGALRTEVPASVTEQMPEDDAEIRRLLNKHNGLSIRLSTYLYVIDNAHKEFQKALAEQTDKAYFNLVMETDRSESVSEIVNNYVTPLLSTTQLGTDVNLIVAYLEKAGSADSGPDIQSMKADTDKALKRINAAFGLHKEDTNLAAIEDITFQIVSFAHGPNNIFEIKQEILSLEESIGQQFELYDSTFASIREYSRELRTQYVETLYTQVDSIQTYLTVLLGLSLMIFAGSLAFVLKSLISDKEAKTLQQETAGKKGWSGKDMRLEQFNRAKKALSGLSDNVQNRLDSLVQRVSDFKTAGKDDHVLFEDEDESGSDPTLKQNSDFSNLPGYESSSVENTRFGEQRMKHGRMMEQSPDDDIQPLLLDTTMRIEAQRQRLKKALSELDDSEQNRHHAKTYSEHKIDEIIATQHDEQAPSRSGDNDGALADDDLTYDSPHYKKQGT